MSLNETIIVSKMEEVMRPSTLPFRASFDPSNSFGFLQKVFIFVGKETYFMRKNTAKKEITTAIITAVKKRLIMESKKKTEVKNITMLFRKSTLPFSASLDRSNPLGFFEKVLDFLGKESNFLMKYTAEKEITTAFMTAKKKIEEDSVKITKYKSQIRAPSSRKENSSSRHPLRPPSIYGDKEEQRDVGKDITKKIEKQLTKVVVSSALALPKQKKVLLKIQDREECKHRKEDAVSRKEEEVEMMQRLLESKEDQENMKRLLETYIKEQENLNTHMKFWRDKYETEYSLRKETEEALSKGIQELELVQALLETYDQEADVMRQERDNALKLAKEIVEERQPPPSFFCPITQEIMEDPHLAADGFTYEAIAIKEWFSTGHNTSPMTNLKLAHLNLVPNHTLRSAIQELV